MVAGAGWVMARLPPVTVKVPPEVEKCVVDALKRSSITATPQASVLCVTEVRADTLPASSKAPTATT